MPQSWSAALLPELPLPPITEIKRRLDGSQARFDCQLCAIKPGRRAAVIYYLDRDWSIPQLSLTIPAGSLSTGFFWSQRLFNLYHWMTPEGETLGDYFNLAGETHLTLDRIEWLDLVVDYCIMPGKPGVFLDEDELPAELPSALRNQILAGKEELLARGERLARWAEAISGGYLNVLGRKIVNR